MDRFWSGWRFVHSFNNSSRGNRIFAYLFLRAISTTWQFKSCLLGTFELQRNSRKLIDLLSSWEIPYLNLAACFEYCLKPAARESDFDSTVLQSTISVRTRISPKTWHSSLLNEWMQSISSHQQQCVLRCGNVVVLAQEKCPLDFCVNEFNQFHSFIQRVLIGQSSHVSRLLFRIK